MNSASAPRAATEGPTNGQAPLTVDRYLATLYPRFAWEATLRLGDVSTAGRLVERVLHRAWRERERFAAADALLRHAAESAEAAIAREEARRLSVTRFDPEDGVPIAPGDMSPLSLSAVSERLRTGRAPAPTPPTGAATVASASEPRAAAAPSRPTLDMPAARPTRDAVAARPTLAHDAPGPRLNEPATAQLNHTATLRARPQLRSAAHITPAPTTPWSKPLIAKVAGGVAILLIAMWRLTASPSGAAAARRAAADSTAALVSTGRGERRDSLLAPGLRVALGPSSSVSTPGALAHGVRGVKASGFLALDAAVDSANPVIIRASGHELEFAGGKASLLSAGDTLFVFAEAADVTHHGKAVTRIASGQTVRIAADGAIDGLDRVAAAEHFAWRQGRLITGRVPARDLRGPVGTWFGLELVTDVRDSLALDVALDSAAALPAAVARTPGLLATLDGQKLTISRAPEPKAVRRRAAAPPPPEIELPLLRKLPGVP